MAVENDYNLLVFTLNELAKTTSRIRDEVERHLLQEAQDEQEPDRDTLGAILLTELPLVSGPATSSSMAPDRF